MDLASSGTEIALRDEVRAFRLNESTSEPRRAGRLMTSDHDAVPLATHVVVTPRSAGGLSPARYAELTKA